MRYVVALLLTMLVMPAQAQDYEKYINDCGHYGALAAAVYYVKDNKYLSEEYLVSSEIDFFKRSGVSELDQLFLVDMIKRVYRMEQKSSEAELFETFAAECVLIMSKPAPVASPPPEDQVPVRLDSPDDPRWPKELKMDPNEPQG